MKNFALSLVCMVLVILACSNSRQENSATTPAPKSARIVANTAVTDPKARYLGEVTAYIGNLFEADKRMVESFAKSDGSQIKDSIIKAHAAEAKDFEAIGPPPAEYRNIHARIQKIHRDHVAAYTEYLRTFIDLKGSHVDRGNAKLKESILYLDKTREIISATLDRDVAR